MLDTQKPHSLLAQVPLTVSPFISIPTAVTLPYTFRSVPSSLPPTIIHDVHNGGKTKFVKSASGHAANPEDIISSCQSLQNHISTSAEDAKTKIQAWKDDIKEKELAEKRRVAPGWLDRNEKMLEPTRNNAKLASQDLLGDQSTGVNAPVMSPNREGEELDRVFGRVGIE